MEDEPTLGDASGGLVPPMVTYIALAALLALTATMALWEYSAGIYYVTVVAWLVVAAGLATTPLFRRMSKLDGLRLTTIVLLAALAIRFLMLFQDAILTNDIVAFVTRGQRYLDGGIPYTEDFQVNKPPAYLLLAAGMGATVGPSLVGTRAVMCIVDAVVAVLIFWMGEERFSRSFGLLAGLLYAINPISAVSIGISGHYDPWVVAFTMGGVWMMLRGWRGWASLLLGMGFALKLYPIVLLPWVLLDERSWPKRLLYVGVFTLPMVVSWIPMLAQNPDALSFYLDYQDSWIPKKGIAHGIAVMAGWDLDSAAAGNAARAVEYVFYGLLAAMFIDWLRRRQLAPGEHLLDWFRVVTGGFYVLYGFILIAGVIEYEIDLGLDPRTFGIVLGVIYFILAGIGLWWLWTRWLPGEVGFSEADQFIMLAAMSVNLLLLSSAQYNVWYLLWLLPLVLLVRSRRIRDAWNGLLVWNAEGSGFSIIPGSGL